jgi:hypothetical protein
MKTRLKTRIKIEDTYYITYIAFDIKCHMERLPRLKRSILKTRNNHPKVNYAEQGNLCELLSPKQTKP